MPLLMTAFLQVDCAAMPSRPGLSSLSTLCTQHRLLKRTALLTVVSMQGAGRPASASQIWQLSFAAIFKSAADAGRAARKQLQQKLDFALIAADGWCLIPYWLQGARRVACRHAALCMKDSSSSCPFLLETCDFKTDDILAQRRSMWVQVAVTTTLHQKLTENKAPFGPTAA